MAGLRLLRSIGRFFVAAYASALCGIVVSAAICAVLALLAADGLQPSTALAPRPFNANDYLQGVMAWSLFLVVPAGGLLGVLSGVAVAAGRGRVQTSMLAVTAILLLTAVGVALALLAPMLIPGRLVVLWGLLVLWLAAALWISTLLARRWRNRQL